MVNLITKSPIKINVAQLKIILQAVYLLPRVCQAFFLTSPHFIVADVFSFYCHAYFTHLFLLSCLVFARKRQGIFECFKKKHKLRTSSYWLFLCFIRGFRKKVNVLLDGLKKEGDKKSKLFTKFSLDSINITGGQQKCSLLVD